MKAAIKKLFASLGYRVQGTRFTPQQLFDETRLRSLELQDVVARLMLEKGQNLGLLQVGAYDGVSTDPFRRYLAQYPWSAVLVEPQPDAVQKLEQLYSDCDRVSVVHAAVTDANGETELYVIDSDDLPRWVGGMASLSREHLAQQTHIVPDIELRIRSVMVPTVTFTELLNEHPHFHVDILQIDAEGADGELLSLFPFDRVKPLIVHWEVKNLTKVEQESAFELMINHGYLIARSGDEDAMAVRAFSS